MRAYHSTMERMHTRNRWNYRTGTTLWCWLGLPIAACAAPPAQTAHPLHLDLRPPALSELTSLKAVIGERRRVPPPTVEDVGGDVHALPSHLIGAGETLVQRFGHEGLPVARLWENHAALVSLGLNPRGKPGLWLVQKTH